MTFTIYCNNAFIDLKAIKHFQCVTFLTFPELRSCQSRIEYHTSCTTGGMLVIMIKWDVPELRQKCVNVMDKIDIDIVASR